MMLVMMMTMRTPIEPYRNPTRVLFGFPQDSYFGLLQDSQPNRSLGLRTGGSRGLLAPSSALQGQDDDDAHDDDDVDDDDGGDGDDYDVDDADDPDDTCDDDDADDPDDTYYDEDDAQGVACWSTTSRTSCLSLFVI